MEVFKTLNEKSKRGIIDFRNFIASKEFNEYKSKLIKLAKIENKLKSLDEEIFGTRKPLKVGILTKSITPFCTLENNYGFFVINPDSKTITINEHLSAMYGNGCTTIVEDSIKPHTFSTEGTCFGYEEVIIALRRLKKKLDDEVKMKVADEKRKFNLKKNKAKKKKSDGLRFREYFNEEEICYKYYKELLPKSDYIRLFIEIVANYDFISYYIISYFKNGFSVKGNSNIDKIYTYFNEHLTSLNELFKYDAHISLKNESTYEGAMFALKTIESEVEAANFLAYHNPDYSTLKKEYEELRSDILKIENMHLKAFYFN